MIKVYCDMCGKELKSDYSNVVNLDFNCYGTVDFDRGHTYNLCKKCAIKAKAYLSKATGESEADNEQTTAEEA